MNLSRRRFLQTTAATAAVALINVPLAQAANVSGYKAMVCLFLFGGLDTHDVVIPYDQSSYDDFAAVRGSLMNQYGAARARENLLALNPDNASDFGSRAFALPPEMPLTKSLFDQGNAAIVPNVGPLIVPTTKSEAEDALVALPPKLFSHNDQQSVWQASSPEGAQFGWGGIFADAMIQFNANGRPEFTAITAAQNALFLTGEEAIPYQLTLGDNSTEILLLEQLANDQSQAGQQAYNILRQHFRPDMFAGTNLLRRDMAEASVNAIDVNEAFAEAIRTLPPLTTAFPQSMLGNQLSGVASAIQARINLQAQRQIFFVGIGGFDTHSEQAETLPALLTQIDGAVSSFFAAMTEIGLQNDVTLFTASDFGRTLAINGDGTDHGWGSHQLVVGGAVNGNRIYGDIPPPVLGHDNDVGSGRLLPSLSVDQYAAPIGRWFGLNEAEIAAALPNLGNFSAPDLTFI